jgi:uncharacterized protein (DUF433 family)
MNLRDRIAVDPAVRFGKPCVRDRISAGDILAYLAGGVLKGPGACRFPQLARDA